MNDYLPDMYALMMDGRELWSGRQRILDGAFETYSEIDKRFVSLHCAESDEEVKYFLCYHNEADYDSCVFMNQTTGEILA